MDSEPVLTIKKRILAVGKFKHPEDASRPYFICLDWFAGSPPLVQPCDEETFFKTMNQLVERDHLYLDVVPT